jgi:GNAT superfamily N-acetyltransferase
MMKLQLLRLKGPDIITNLDKIGHLRLNVFRDYPYLYDGTLEDEFDYLKSYSSSETSLVVLAMDGENAVGASTCLKLNEADSGFRSAFQEAGLNTDSTCYLGESVLLASYRGLGIGKQFFQYREAHARDVGCTMTAFCAVDRPKNHPLRPSEYQELDGFWQAQGYVKHPELKATFMWKEVQQTEETAKTLTFWIKELDSPSL